MKIMAVTGQLPGALSIGYPKFKGLPASKHDVIMIMENPPFVDDVTIKTHQLYDYLWRIFHGNV